MLSAIIEKNPEFKKYTKSWEEILQKKINNPVANKITENYSSGVYLSYEQVKKLHEDYINNPSVKKIIDDTFSHDRINVLMKAIKFCLDNKLGLLEATEVLTPNPLDLNNTFCYSNLFNCDQDGALLYEKAAMQQLADL